MKIAPNPKYWSGRQLAKCQVNKKCRNTARLRCGSCFRPCCVAQHSARDFLGVTVGLCTDCVTAGIAGALDYGVELDTKIFSMDELVQYAEDANTQGPRGLAWDGAQRWARDARSAPRVQLCPGRHAFERIPLRCVLTKGHEGQCEDAHGNLFVPDAPKETRPSVQAGARGVAGSGSSDG